MRSDTYSLTVLFHEFLYLRHYLEGRESLTDVLEGVQKVTPDLMSIWKHAHQPAVPAELSWFLAKGFQKDPARRYQSVEEMMDVLQGAMDGRIHVQCQRTMLKRGLHKMLRMVDESPNTVIIGSTLAVVVVLAALGNLLMALF